MTKEFERLCREKSTIEKNKLKRLDRGLEKTLEAGGAANSLRLSELLGAGAAA